MDPRIQQVLLAQAAQEAEEGPRLSDMVALGSGGGAALGALMGVVPHAVGRGVGHIRGNNRMLKPGARMAGGIIGALLGGGLGAAAQQQVANEAGPAGALLAKIQSQGGLMPGDEASLESVLRDAYSQQGLIG
ncbi:MAG: hypothetical protein CMJ25_10890 [Phycisphaerae bacterium]|nr:hypothetical protein [Phycisphaerae bacterium]|tara:strand:- start:5401 stop:5799 length:399 start_codon:yes stop_codon:yes gene_type:complete